MFSRPFRSAALLALGLLPIASQLVAATVRPADPAATLQSAVALLEGKKFSAAAGEFERANEISGGRCAPCILGAGSAWLAAGRRDKAGAAGRRVIDLPAPSPPAPQLARAYNLIATAAAGPRAGKAERKEAEAALRKAVELDPLVSYRLNLGAVLLQEDQAEEALKLAREVLPTTQPADEKQARILICQARAALPDGQTPPPGTEGAPPSDPEVHHAGQGVSRPEILLHTQPQYTKDARKAGLNGTVATEAVIDEEGCVTNVKLLQSLDPGLDASAIETIRHWVFQPATLEGKPVKVYYSLTVNFSLQRSVNP